MIDITRNQSFYTEHDQNFKHLQFSKDIQNLIGNTLFKKDKFINFTNKE